jgi:hypothetical protein
MANVPPLAAFAGSRPGASAPTGHVEPPAFDADTARVFGVIAKAATVDEVALAAEIDVERAQGILARLEIDGRAERDPMGRFTRAGGPA